jgi:hypothetical protein
MLPGISVPGTIDAVGRICGWDNRGSDGLRNNMNGLSEALEHLRSVGQG